MIIVKGDLLKSPMKIWAHQVNCIGVMDAGVAKSIRVKYPDVYFDYLDFVKENREDCLGKYCFTTIGDGIIWSIFGQYDVGTNAQKTDYNALRRGLVSAITDYRKNYNISSIVQIPIGIPYKIGCGLAGGDWEEVYRILTDIEEIYNVLFIACRLA